MQVPNLPADVNVPTRGSLVAPVLLVQPADALLFHGEHLADGTVLQIVPVRSGCQETGADEEAWKAFGENLQGKMAMNAVEIGALRGKISMEKATIAERNPD